MVSLIEAEPLVNSLKKKALLCCCAAPVAYLAYCSLRLTENRDVL